MRRKKLPPPAPVLSSNEGRLQFLELRLRDGSRLAQLLQLAQGLHHVSARRSGFRFPKSGAADPVDVHEALSHLAGLVERLHHDMRAAHGEGVLHQARDGAVAVAAFAFVAAALPVDPGDGTELKVTRARMA